MKSLNKRAASLDNIYIMILFFIVCIALLVFTVFWNVASSIPGELWTSTQGAAIKSNTQAFVNTWDFIGLMFYIGSHLGVLFLSYLLRTSPVMYIPSIIFTSIMLVISVPLSNVYEGLQSNVAFITANNGLPIIGFIMYHLPKFEVVWAFITIIVLYGLSGRGGDL